jgi:hypothetical protein
MLSRKHPILAPRVTDFGANELLATGRSREHETAPERPPIPTRSRASKLRGL